MLKAKIHKIGTLVLDLFYPRRCRFCNEVIGFTSCEKCEREIAKIKRPKGASLQREARNMDCLTYAFAPYNYDSPVSDAILRLKFSKKALEVKAFANDILIELKSAENLPKLDIVTCVPSTKMEESEHGRNLPYILAEEIAKELSVPFAPDLLTKTRETKRQMMLTGAQRRKNIKNAFAVTDDERVRGKSVLIADDVFTTGSTLNECAEILRKSGAVSCVAVTIAAAVI